MGLKWLAGDKEGTWLSYWLPGFDYKTYPEFSWRNFESEKVKAVGEEVEAVIAKENVTFSRTRENRLKFEGITIYKNQLGRHFVVEVAPKELSISSSLLNINWDNVRVSEVFDGGSALLSSTRDATLHQQILAQVKKEVPYLSLSSSGFSNHNYFFGPSKDFNLGCKFPVLQ